MIKSEIHNLMEKMDNASKSIFESYDFATKNNVEDKNIKIEDLSRFSKESFKENRKFLNMVRRTSVNLYIQELQI